MKKERLLDMREIVCSTRGCNCRILRKSNDGYWRFSTKVIKAVGDGSIVIAVCKSCGQEVLLPVSLTMPSLDSGTLQKSEESRGFGIIEKQKA